MTVSSSERRIALFIDFENLVTNTGISPSSFDLRPSLDLLLERGKVIFRRAYCDWGRFREAKGGLHEFGVELIDVPPTTRSGKNGADMRLVIDALELNYARHHIDTFAIASGDSDFVPLANKLRENDKRVIGMGVKEATSPFFVRACDEFLYLPTDRVRRAASPEKHARGGNQRGKRGDGGREAKETPKIPDLAREVVSGLLSRATGPINPSLIKETMVRREPDFDESDHGFATFSKLLEAMEREGILKRQRLGGRQWYVVPPDVEVSDVAGAPAASAAEEEIPDPLD
ncbi:MAG TPA: NYN domain-containing protein [Myxococcaceae bacterium]|nr:NYN domain-containing protein [Myxococcaceae bacterium]